MKPTVYIETTIVSYLTARPSRDIVKAAWQQITHEWWEDRRDRFDLFTSQLVLIEAAAGDAEAATRRLDVLKDITQLAIPDRFLELADAFATGMAIPTSAARDAEHVAVAALNGIDVLLTWNCTHLANVMLRDRIEQVCEDAGLRAPRICTPEELIGDWI